MWDFIIYLVIANYSNSIVQINENEKKKTFYQALSAEDEVAVISIILEFIQGETYKLYALCYKALKVVSIKNNKDYEKNSGKIVPG